MRLRPSGKLFASFRGSRARIVAASVVGVALLSWGALYATSCYRQFKAKKLLSELQTLPAGATASRAREIVQMYDSAYVEDCGNGFCVLTAVIENVGPFTVLTRSTLWDYVGLRPWIVRGSVTLTNGVVVSSGYSVFFGVGRGKFLHHDGLLGTAIWTWLDAGFGMSDRGLQQEQSLYRKHQIPVHADFLIKKPCLTTYGGGESMTVLTSRNSPAPIAFDINLKCLNAFHPCTELCQVVPSAWRQFVSDGAVGCNMDAEALERARRACGAWAGDISATARQ